VIVCDPTVYRVTFIVARPLLSWVEEGVTPAGSVVVSFTSSLLLSWFHHVSVAKTVTENGVPEIWLEGVPDSPLGRVGFGTWHGSRICRRLKLPALTLKPSLVPSLLG